MNSGIRIVKVWCAVFSLALLVTLSPPALAWQAVTHPDDIPVGAQAEWHPAKVILMHTPESEIFWGVIHPDAGLFEKPFGLRLAQEQHRHYIKLMEEQGATVHTVVNVLLQGTIDDQGRPIEGKSLDELRDFAKAVLVYDTSALDAKEREDQEKYKDQVLAQLTPWELIQIILERPTVKLHTTGTNTGFSAAYKADPLMNLYFCRDQMITTAKGIVISRMNSLQRAAETELMKFVLKKMGIDPIYEVTGQGRLEGGDYFSAGDIAMIGQGLRTNAEGVRQLLDNKVFGLPRVAVVKDSWKDQEEMHLDTYFNIIGPKLAALVDLRMDLPGKPADKKMKPLVDVYELEDGVYVKKIADKDFQEFLEKDLGYTLIPLSRKDQNLYGVNFLTMKTNRIMAIDGVSEEYKKRIKDHGVDAAWMDFSALTSGYGAAHCTTQVISREKPQ